MHFDDEAMRSTRMDLFNALSGHGLIVPCRPVPGLLIEILEQSAERRLQMRDPDRPNVPSDPVKSTLTSRLVRSRIAALMQAYGALLNAWKGSAGHSLRRLRT